MSEPRQHCDINLMDLKCKDVVNICDGKRLGRIIDVVLDCKNGKIKGVVLPGCKGFSLFKSPEDIFLPWKCILRIGEDVILVEVFIKQHMTGGHKRGKDEPFYYAASAEQVSDCDCIDDEVHPRVMKYVTAAPVDSSGGE